MLFLSVPAVSSVTVTTIPDTISTAGTNISVFCTVELGPVVLESDLSLLLVYTQLSRDGTTLALTGPTVVGTKFIYSFQIKSFTACDNGNYVCAATVSPQFASPYIIGNGTLTGQATVVVGKTV